MNLEGACSTREFLSIGNYAGDWNKKRRKIANIFS